MTKMIKMSLVATLMAAGLSASAAEIEKRNYVGFKTGSLSHDTAISYPNESSEVTSTVDKFDPTGLSFNTLHVKESGLLWGGGFDAYSAYDGFGIGLNIKFGVAPEFADKKLALYGLAGYDLGLVTDYQSFSGSSFGVGANYDFTDDFAFTVEYKTMSLSLDADGVNGTSYNTDVKPKGLMAAISFKY